ncbi:Hypothetical protein PHPALM_1018 [Phytophthora palmivora]|uniref:Uncharacterized protein n=1 Tax=Phytophthora palmivora TaxID=4796 RepID=A0A2P4YTE5_9STRA|nr:Hypothetical protein PHPALM_1018 [Phytophthora palmivora]
MEGPRVDIIRYQRFDGKNKPVRDYSEETRKRRNKWKNNVLLFNDILTNTSADGTRVRLAHLEKPQEKWSTLVVEFEKKSFNVALFKRREL